MAEEAQQAKLLSERAAREARMEDAIVRARIRLEHEERLSWSRRLEQAALAVRSNALRLAWLRYSSLQQPAQKVLKSTSLRSRHC